MGYGAIRLGALGAGLAAALAAPHARAQAVADQAQVAPPPGERTGFGRRSSFVFSLERVFGMQQQELGPYGVEYDTVGMSPVYWGYVGLFGITSRGFSYGALLGYSRIAVEDYWFSVARLGPRFGYAGSLQPKLGIWLRGGPSLFVAFDDNDSLWALSASFEGYFVMQPAPHFGVLVGPHVDLPIAGDSDGETVEYKSFGITLGLMGEI